MHTVDVCTVYTVHEVQMRSLVEQVRAAQVEKGWSVQKLLAKSGLTIDRSSLQRKLCGDVPTTDQELEALARAMRITLIWPRPRK